MDGVVAHSGRVGVACLPLVGIIGLGDASVTRARGVSGPLVVSEEFTVSPVGAECSVASDSDVVAVLSFPDDSGATRTVAARISDHSGTVRVEVTCSLEGEYAPTTAEADLMLDAQVSVEDVSAEATSGGGCEPAAESAMLADGVDEGWDCWMAVGGELTVVVTATDPSDGLSLSWPTDARTGGVTLTDDEGDESFDEVTAEHRRSTTAEFSCTDDGTARVVTTLDGAEAHVGLVSVDCRPLVTISGLDGNAASTRSISDDFTVSPSSATCTTAVSGIAATATVSASPRQGSTHRVSVRVTGTATGTVTVEVTCSAEVGTQKYAPATARAEFVRFGDCTDDLGTLGHGSVSRSGTIVADEGCMSWKRGTTSAPNYARRYTFRVPAASRVSVDAASAQVDTYLYVLHGNGAAAEVLGRDNDGHTAGRTDSRVADVRVLPGVTYVAEVTTNGARQTGAFTLTVTAQPDLPAVKITGLAPVTLIRNGTHTLTAGFTVEPATAQCTAAAPASVTAQNGGSRTVSRQMTGSAQVTVVVRCSGDGNSDGIARTQFSLFPAVGRAAVKALSGGSCTASTKSLPAGVDARYGCETNESVTLKVSATSWGAHATPELAWSGSTGVTVAELTAGTAQRVVREMGPVEFTRTGTAGVACTDDGTVMVAVTAGVDTYTVQLDIACGPHPAAHCADGIGMLGEGVTTRTGNITADRSCVSLRRKPGDWRRWYARRHTFSLDAAATVTFVLEGVPAARPGLNVYLMLLTGDAPDGSGAQLRANNNDNSNAAANRLNSRLADVALEAGTYTVEATTFHPYQTGQYSLKIIAPAVRDSVAVTATSGGRCETSDDSPPAGVDDLWECAVEPQGRLRVLANARSGATSFAHTWTATDGVTIPEGPHNPEILTRQGPDEADTAWRQASRITLACTTDGTADLTVGFGTASAKRTRKVRLDIDCNTPVQIEGLTDVTENGTTGQTLTVTAPFTVEPADAQCTPTGTATVTKPVGGDPDDRIVTVSLTVESAATVTVTCTAAGRPDGVAKVVLRAQKTFTVSVEGEACAVVPASIPRSYRCALSDEHEVTLGVSAAADTRDLKMSWAATGGAAVVSSRRDAVTQLEDPAGISGFGWLRSGAVSVECTADGSVAVAVTAGDGDAQVTRTAPVSIDCQDQGRITGFADTTATGIGTVSVTRRFTVSPADAPCTVTSTAGRAAVDSVLDGAEEDRTVSVALAVAAGADVSAAVTVDCTPPGHAPVIARATFAAGWRDRCDDPLGVLAHGVITRSGTITRDARCVSAQGGRDPGGADQYTRRHTFTLERPARVQIWMSSAAFNSRRLDTYLVLLHGHGTNGRVHSRNDDDGPRNDNSRLSRELLGPGAYTIEATTSLAGHTGDYVLRVDTRLGVGIGGLIGAAAHGTGTVTLTDDFTVDPPRAPCKTTAGTIAPAAGAQRTLTVRVQAGTTTTAVVECDVVLLPAARASAQFEVRRSVESLTVQAASGGSCRKFAGTLDEGVDSKHTCTMTRGDTLVLEAEASGPSSQTVLGWAAGTGVRALPALGDLDAGMVGDRVVFTRDGTAAVTCTTGGDITVNASVDGAVGRTAVAAVRCVPPVQITNYVGDTRNGAGAMRGTFNVAPATARCTASRVDGIDAVGVREAGRGTSRRVRLSTTATGTLDVKVECEAAGHTTATATAQFAAHDDAACVSPLGILRHRTRTFTGALSATSCVSAQRPAAGISRFRAHRYSFTLASSGWVSIDLEPTETGTDALDTYLLLLSGHGSGGTVLHSHDNLRGDATQLDDIYLAAGDYTAEATTALPNSIGGYRIAIAADFAVQSDDLPAAVNATVGRVSSVEINYRPADATVAVQSVTPRELAATVTASNGTAEVKLTPSKARTITVNLAFTASGHTSSDTITVTAYCQTGYRPSPDGTCQPLMPELDESCFQNLPSGREFGRQWRKVVTRDLYMQDCDSVSVSGKTAGYFRFEIPADETSRSTYGLQIDFMLPANATPIGTVPRPGPRPVLPELSVNVWPLGSDGETALTPPLALVESSAVPENGSARRFSAAGVGPGSYVIEAAMPPAAPSGGPPSSLTTNRFTIAATTPSVSEAYRDVKQLGNIWLDGAGATLEGFLDARGTTDYDEHPIEAKRVVPSDLFKPDSPQYRWLSFGVDKCSIPEGVVAAGDAVLDRLFAALWGDWGGIYTGETLGTELEDLIRAEWFRDYPHFGNAEVAYVHAS